MPTLRK